MPEAARAGDPPDIKASESSKQAAARRKRRDEDRMM
jgi:hypothetical protein